MNDNIVIYGNNYLADKIIKTVRKNVTLFIVSMCIGFITYGFVISNKLVNHDELYSLFSKGATLVSGRWGLDLISYILPDYSMPWLWGSLTLVFISVAICITVNIFDIRNKVLQYLLAGLIMCSPSLIGTLCYMFTSCAFGLAILLSVLAVYFLIKETWWGSIIALVSMVLSLGIYQAYISVTASFLVVFLIQSILKNEADAKSIVKKGCRYIVFLGLSLAIYYFLTQGLLYINGMSLGEYASDKTELKFGIAVRICYAYYQFIKYFLLGSFGLINTMLSKIVHILCVILVLALIIMIRRKAKAFSQNVLLIILLVLLPLSINCMYIFVNAGAVHTLVVYGFIAVYVLAAVVIEAAPCELKPDIIKNILMVGMVIIIANNIFIANKIYLKMHMEYENMYSYYNSIMTQVKMTPGFDASSKVALVGTAPESSYMEGFGSIDIMGFPDDMKDRNKELFIYYYLGSDIPFASEEEKERLAEHDEFKKMEVYPYYGSVQKLDDYIVVKLSE